MRHPMIAFDVDKEKTENICIEKVRCASEMIESSIRDTDIVARYARNEFMIVLPVTDRTGAAILATRR